MTTKTPVPGTPLISENQKSVVTPTETDAHSTQEPMSQITTADFGNDNASPSFYSNDPTENHERRSMEDLQDILDISTPLEDGPDDCEL